jgi:hypothetical protein
LELVAGTEFAAAGMITSLFSSFTNTGTYGRGFGGTSDDVVCSIEAARPFVSTTRAAAGMRAEACCWGERSTVTTGLTSVRSRSISTTCGAERRVTLGGGSPTAWMFLLDPADGVRTNDAELPLSVEGPATEFVDVVESRGGNWQPPSVATSATRTGRRREVAGFPVIGFPLCA